MQLKIKPCRPYSAQNEHRSILKAGGVLFIFVLAACSGRLPDSSSVTPVDISTRQPIPAKLSDQLVYLTPLGIEVLDPQTQEITNPEKRHILAPREVEAIPSPDGTYLAYITGQSGFQNLTLNFLSLADGSLYEQLLFPDTFNPPAQFQLDDPGVNAIRAIVEVTSFDWSPSGDSIVLTTMTGDSIAGLFLLKASDLSAPPLPLSTHTGHVVHPRWSPDGQTVVYQTVSDFGEGDGFQVTGVWSVRNNGSDRRSLYIPMDSKDEILAGWVSKDTFLVHSRLPECGYARLRTFNLPTKEQNILWETPFNAIAYDDLTHSVLVSVDRFTAGCGGGSPGLFHFYLQPAGEPVIYTTLTQKEAFLPTFHPASGLFLARTTDSVLAFRPPEELSVLEAPEPFLPAVSPDASFAWASPISGVWVGAGREAPRRITSSPAGLPVWTSEGSALYFLDADGLWLARSPDFRTELIASGFSASSAFWLRIP